jgi:iron complex outermembrane receptor protein
MKTPIAVAGAASALVLSLAIAPADLARAQQAEQMEEVVVTGSRIRRNPLNEPVEIMEIGAGDIEDTGMTNLGDALQQLPITGSAINSKFNVPGNSGFPQDGSGIGAGAAQLSIRNVSAKRTLVLVDGKRWIAGASASGVPNAVDLNTIPDNVIERVEILQDGASAIYGSDAIGGVVNVITRQNFEGFRLDAQAGSYLDDNDGESYEFSALWGGGNDTTHFVMSLGYRDERGVETWDRSRSRYPSPDATSCDAGGCSSFTPQARLLFGPGIGLYRDGVLDPSCTLSDGTTDPDCGTLNITLNDGVLNDGDQNIPSWDPSTSGGGDDFHEFTSADRFNFNGPGFNYLRTPNERVNAYVNVRHQMAPSVTLFARASYTNRQSATKAAPEPLCLGNGCGTRITDNFLISASNPYNFTRQDLSVANGNLEFFGRRPLESGGRLFFQDVNTYMIMAGLEGEFQGAGRNFYWDLTAGYGDNRGFQEKFNSHNAARLQVAMGPRDVCNATPNCVPFNFFGGQGPDGTGSITQEMLDFVGYTQRDFSEQTLKNYAFNLGGDVVELPGGMMGFAFGLEYRDHEGSFRPDPIAASGETAGIPSGGTEGGFDVTEFYGELNIPLIAGASLADLLEVNLAARSSDYSTSGSQTTYKISGLWRPIDQLSLRGSFSTGFRAPGIGELFGGAAREDFTFLDPCADYLGDFGTAAGGREEAQPQNIQDNCAALDVAPGLLQVNPQLSALSVGNEALEPEESENITAGIVYSPAWSEGQAWADGITLSVDYYSVEIDDAVQGLSPGELIDACVETLDPVFCDNTPRTSSGQLDTVQNRLQNLGGIDASGVDIAFSYLSPETGVGTFTLDVDATHLNEYVERTSNPDGTESSNDLTGRAPDETFFRAFPEWRAVTSVGWNYNNFTGLLRFRWVDEMDNQVEDDGSMLDSVTFTDLRLTWTPDFANDALALSLGFNNVFDEDPPVCQNCGVIGMNPVAHDLPGRVGYIRVSYQQ